MPGAGGVVGRGGWDPICASGVTGRSDVVARTGSARAGVTARRHRRIASSGVSSYGRGVELRAECRASGGGSSFGRGRGAGAQWRDGRGGALTAVARADRPCAPGYKVHNAAKPTSVTRAGNISTSPALIQPRRRPDDAVWRLLHHSRAPQVGAPKKRAGRARASAGVSGPAACGPDDRHAASVRTNSRPTGFVGRVGSRAPGRVRHMRVGSRARGRVRHGWIAGADPARHTRRIADTRAPGGGGMPGRTGLPNGP